MEIAVLALFALWLAYVAVQTRRSARR